MGYILVIGGINIDMTVSVPHLPSTGETVQGNAFYNQLGGKGANQAVSAKRAGGKVKFIACVGDDSSGHKAIAAYKQDGIDTSHIEVIHNSITGVALISVDNESNNMISVAPGANAYLSPKIVQNKQTLILNSDILLLQLEVALETVTSAIDIAASKNRFIILDPSPGQKLPKELLAKVNILTPNETETEILTNIKIKNIDSAKHAADVLLSYGIQNVIITLGNKGILYANDTLKKHIPCFKVNAIDSTAAGDSFNGALAAAINCKQSILHAIHFAQAAAALSVTKVGAQKVMPQLSDINAFIAASKFNKT